MLPKILKLSCNQVHIGEPTLHIDYVDTLHFNVSRLAKLNLYVLTINCHISINLEHITLILHIKKLPRFFQIHYAAIASSQASRRIDGGSGTDK